MIVRLWHGRVNSSKADEYADFMRERAAPDYGSVDGLQKLFFLRREEGDVTHFLLITFWDLWNLLRSSRANTRKKPNTIRRMTIFCSKKRRNR